MKQTHLFPKPFILSTLKLIQLFFFVFFTLMLTFSSVADVLCLFSSLFLLELLFSLFCMVNPILLWIAAFCDALAMNVFSTYVYEKDHFFFYYFRFAVVERTLASTQPKRVCLQCPFPQAALATLTFVFVDFFKAFIITCFHWLIWWWRFIWIKISLRCLKRCWFFVVVVRVSCLCISVVIPFYFLRKKMFCQSRG